MHEEKGKRKAWIYSRNSCVDNKPAERDFEVIVDYRLSVSHVKQIQRRKILYWEV